LFKSVCLAAASSLLTDIVWPALLLEGRLLSTIPILTGLVVEWLALRFGGFGLSWKRAAIVDVAMNAVSTAVGVVLIPALGIAWELFPGSVLYKLFNIGTFNPGTWIATFVIAVLATTAVEAGVVRWGFKVPLGRRRFSTLCGANCLSVAIAFVSLWTHPPKF
jgi:hypothetical protein